MARLAATQGLPLLEAAVHERPDDLAAREFLGHALRDPGPPRGRAPRFRGDSPASNRTASWPCAPPAACLPAFNGRTRARSASQKTIAVNPWRLGLSYWDWLQDCYQSGDWSGAVAACQEAIRINPELFAARSLLIQSFLRSHQLKADAEYQTLLRLYPASREVWGHWYQSQKQAGRAAVDFSKTSTP